MACRSLRAERAVDDAVIDAERDRHDGGDCELAVLAHHGFLHACADREDRAMGRVD